MAPKVWGWPQKKSPLLLFKPWAFLPPVIKGSLVRPLKTSVDACGESPRNDATVGHHAGTIDAFGEPVGGILSIPL